jgi:hypothetical protein
MEEVGRGVEGDFKFLSLAKHREAFSANRESMAGLV